MGNVLPVLQPVIDNLMAAQERLEQVVARIEPIRWQQWSSNPGWTYKDLLAHLATGDWVCQHRLHGLLETGGVPDSPDVDAGNAERIAARRGRSVQELMEERARHRRQTLDLIERLTVAQLEQPIDMSSLGIGTVPFIRYLQGFPAHDIGHAFELEAIAAR